MQVILVYKRNDLLNKQNYIVITILQFIFKLFETKIINFLATATTWLTMQYLDAESLGQRQWRKGSLFSVWGVETWTV